MSRAVKHRMGIRLPWLVIEHENRPSLYVYARVIVVPIFGRRDRVSREHNRSLDVRRAPILRAKVDVGTKVGPRALARDRQTRMRGSHGRERRELLQKAAAGNRGRKP